MNEEELRHRIKNAIILLTDGQPFKVGDLTFGSRDNNHFSVTGWTVKTDMENISQQTALTELNETKELFNEMKKASSELYDFIQNRQIEYCLAFNYGMGSLDICIETNGELKWVTKLKK